MSRVIALSGYKKSGKDTVAEYLVEHYGYERISFADALKDLVSTQYGISRRYLDNQIYKETPLADLPVISTDKFGAAIHELLQAELRSGYWTPRAILILEGSIKRAVNSRYWTQSVIQEIQSTPNDRYVITDMRFQSELSQLRTTIGNDLLTMRIERFAPEEIDTQDPSERDLDGVMHDLHLHNKGTLDELHRAIDTMGLEPYVEEDPYERDYLHDENSNIV